KTPIVATLAGKRVAFDVVFHPVAGQAGQGAHVLGPDVALVRARMHGDAAATGIHAHAGRGAYIGLVLAAGVAQQGDLVEIDAEKGHGVQARHVGREETVAGRGTDGGAAPKKKARTPKGVCRTLEGKTTCPSLG